MARFLLGRVIGSAALLVVVSFVLFSFLYLAPGNPIAVLTGGHPVLPEQLAALRAHYHLDEPFLVQFGYWFGNVLQATSARPSQVRPRSPDVVRPKILPTFELAAYAWVLVLLFGVGGGIMAAVTQGKLVRRPDLGDHAGRSVDRAVRLGDRADRGLRVSPRLVPRVRAGERLRRSRRPPDAAGDRARALAVRLRRPRHACGDDGGAAARVRRHRPESWSGRPKRRRDPAPRP